MNGEGAQQETPKEEVFAAERSLRKRLAELDNVVRSIRDALLGACPPGEQGKEPKVSRADTGFFSAITGYLKEDLKAVVTTTEVARKIQQSLGSSKQRT